MSSPEEKGYLSRSNISRSGSIAGEKSRSRSALKKDISMDEGDALKKISEEADLKLKHEKLKTDEARRYLLQRRHQEQAEFSDEENENSTQPDATSTPVLHRVIPSVKLDTSSTVSSKLPDKLSKSGCIDGANEFREKCTELETKYKDAMVSQGKLFDEKTALVYQVESLKDELEDTFYEVEKLKNELYKHQSKVLHAKHKEEVLTSDIDKLKNHIQFRDNFMETHGLHLPTISEEEEDEESSKEVQFFPLSERNELLREISDLKAQVEQAKTAVPVPSADSLLRGEETKDIIRESTRLVGEYKTKLQLADSETTKLQGLVERQKGQISRYKNQLDDMEKREDELLKEKRSQSREIRRLQAVLDDIESENELLKRRVEQMRKRQKD